MIKTGEGEAHFKNESVKTLARRVNEVKKQENLYDIKKEEGKKYFKMNQ